MKKMKVFIQGKRMRDIYPFASKYQVFKYRVRKFFRRLMLIVVGTIVVFIAGTIIRELFPVTVYEVQEKEVVLDNLKIKVDQLKGEIIADIKKGECGHYTDDDGIIIFDSNKKASIGCYQFQKDTVIYYYKKFYGKDITGREAVLIALDDQKASELTYKIVFGEENGWRNWYNTGKKYNLEARLKVIRELEK